jgi:hypothetical protein
MRLLGVARRVLNGPAMKMMKLFTVVAMAGTLALGGCGSKKDNEKRDKLAKLCVASGDALKNDSGGASAETFQTMLSNALMSCSGACDEGDDASCKALDAHVGKICKVSGDMCAQLCSSVDSKSLKDATCKGAKK